MTYEKYRNTLNKEQSAFVRENFDTMTNREMAKALNVKLWQVRYALYPLGLKRMEMEYWTVEQVDFLKANYRGMGDKEIAEIFQEKWPKNKLWTLKHIEKKRLYLKLKRTPEQLKDIKKRNAALGCWMTGKTWETRGQAAIDHIAEWETSAGYRRKYIKLKTGYVPLAPYRWEQANGTIPEAHVIRHKDNDPLNCELENLECIPYEENARRNAQKSSVGLSDNYVVGILTMQEPHLRADIKKRPELVELMRARLILNREINNHKN